MGIHISNYIDIKSKFIKAGSSNVDFSALVFTKEAMLTWSDSGTDPYASLRSDYAANKVVTIDSATAKELFAATGPTYAFCERYFGYEGAPAQINLFKVESAQTALEAFNSATSDFANFGSICYIDSYVSGGTNGLVAVGEALANTNYVLIVPVSSSDYATVCTAFATAKDNVFVVEGTVKKIDNEDYVFIGASVCSWYGAVNYDAKGSSDTINYREFALESATVNTDAGKTAHDTAKCNYIGKIQNHGLQREFMQNGVLLNGQELGVFRDKAWIQALVENGWIAMATDRKIPANYAGAASVMAMVIGVASRGIDSGAILIEKTLSAKQRQDILAYTGDEDAADEVQSKGYYIDAKIVTETDDQTQADRYFCQYTLVYAKGDSISKVSGIHYLA